MVNLQDYVNFVNIKQNVILMVTELHVHHYQSQKEEDTIEHFHTCNSRIHTMFRNCETKKNHGGNLWQVNGGFTLEYF